MTTPTPLAFKSSYQGESEYLYQGKRYGIRYMLQDTNSFTPEYVPFLRRLVGCCYGVSEPLEYPPLEVLANFPGYVAARYTPDYQHIEYQDGLPLQVRRPDGLYSEVYLKEYNFDLVNGRWCVPGWGKKLALAQTYVAFVAKDTTEYRRIPFGEEPWTIEFAADQTLCGDCAARRGQLHALSCDMEQCPRCHNQLLSCDCFPGQRLTVVIASGDHKTEER